MGYRAHVQSKHIVEYGGRCHFNCKQEQIYDWLCANGVHIYGDDTYCKGNEWEIDKDELRAIPDEAYATIHEGTDHEIFAEELREFVDECLAAPTGEYAYVSWF